MFLRIIGFVAALLFCYFLGVSRCQNKVISRQLKEVRHVQKATAVIQAVPHASKPELLELMRRGQL